MSSSPLWLTEADVTASIDLGGAISALERVLAAEAVGQAKNMTKTHVMVGANDALQALGGSVVSEGLCGTKTWVNIAGKSQTLLIVFSLIDGSLQAVIEATALGQIRTAAMSGVGTKWLAPDGADEMTIIGAGKQALPQIAAVRAVRSISRVRIYSRTEAKRGALAGAVRAKFPGIFISECTRLEDAVAAAPIVTLCTNATEPFLAASMVGRDVHINAVGAIVPARAEFFGDIFARCSAIAVDSLDTVKELSREFREYFGSSRASWDLVRSISQVIRDGRGRPANADLTLFKAMGMGIADLAVASEVLRRCKSRGIGQALPKRIRADLPIQVSHDANGGKL
jgi:ornithine cyclodeaminase